MTDRNVAGTTFTSAPVGTSIWPPYTTPALPNGPSWVFPTCQGYATFPALASQEADYSESQNPAFQAKSIRSFAYSGQVVPPLTNVPDAGFGVMDSSEADFNGLNSASLQNADGTFAFPSTQNIEAAVSTATPCVSGCAAGTYVIDYGAAATTTSYPMPDITYALVSTSPQEQPGHRNQEPAHQPGDLLARVGPPARVCTAARLDVPGRAHRHLPRRHRQAAVPDQADVATIIGGRVGDPGRDRRLPPDRADHSTNPTLPLTKAEAARIAKERARRHGSTGIASAATPTGIALLALDEASRYFLPLILVLGVACLIAGPLLYFVPAYRRRHRAAGGSE